MAKTTVTFDPVTQKNVNRWLEGNYDPEAKATILKLQSENPEELLDAFYKNLSFGTGGLRGIMGVGTNRMNSYTVRAATQGLANYISQVASATQNKSVFIGFDCRHHSKEFALEAARVLAAHSIEVFLYKELRPVANISFGVLYKKCIAGIMITASHNPPKYNGYKVYWSYGGQVLPPHDQGIIDEVNKVTDPTSITMVSLPHPLIHEVGSEIDTAYFKAIEPLQSFPEENQAKGHQLKVVYTSLHGGGITMIPQALKEWGFTSLTLVDKQAIPDGDFPTVKSPNPEEHEAMALGVEQLLKVKGDILLGTDPDTDRLGVVVLHQGQPLFFDGNQVACLLLEHLCRAHHQRQTFPPQPTCVKTIVTSELFKHIADHYKVTSLDVLTGFKYIGEKIHEWEELKKEGAAPHFILGAEESYGYLIGTHVRDKDAIVSAACICEAALHMKLQGKSLVDLLYEIYRSHGLFREKLLSITFEGKEGADKMQGLMERLRNHPPNQLGDKQVVLFEDYLNQRALSLVDNQAHPLLLPKSDVLRLWLSDQTKVVVRPSGTEPKIKIYCGARRPLSKDSLEKNIEECDSYLEGLLSELKTQLTQK